MHNGKYVFSQLLDFLDKDVFLRLSNKYDGNRYVKFFTCWNQLAVLMFGQLANRESLRDVALWMPSVRGEQEEVHLLHERLRRGGKAANGKCLTYRDFTS